MLPPAPTYPTSPLATPPDWLFLHPGLQEVLTQVLAAKRSGKWQARQAMLLDKLRSVGQIEFRGYKTNCGKPYTWFLVVLCFVQISDG